MGYFWRRSWRPCPRPCTRQGTREGTNRVYIRGKGYDRDVLHSFTIDEHLEYVPETFEECEGPMQRYSESSDNFPSSTRILTYQPMLRDGDGLTESHTERMSIVRKYDFSKGWLYYYPGKDWIEESNLRSLPLVFPGSKLYTEAEMYSTEAFFPYPCRRSDWCVLNFESKGARNEHETALQLECGGLSNPHNRDRRVQLEINPDFKRRFDLFCRHNDCDEHFPVREALNAHEQQCPFGFAGKFRWQVLVDVNLGYRTSSGPHCQIRGR